MDPSDFKDYYATLGVARDAPQDVIKRAYRKLARKYHPDVSKEANAEARFKDVAEAHEALIDPERRAAYDDLAAEHALDAQARAAGRSHRRPGGASAAGYEFSGRGAAAGFGGHGGDSGVDSAQFSAFFESLFGRGGDSAEARSPQGGFDRTGRSREAASDHHARIEIDLEDAYRGARHSIGLRHPVTGADGRTMLRERQVEVQIPRGIRPGQHLRLAGMGNNDGTHGDNGGPPGDLYLEIAFRPHARYRIDGADLWCDLPLSPWEAALGGPVQVHTPEGEVSLNVPAGSRSGRKLRLKGRGLPVQNTSTGKQPGDLYAVLRIVCPPAHTEAERAAYGAFADAFAGHAPRDDAPHLPPHAAPPNPPSTPREGTPP